MPESAVAGDVAISEYLNSVSTKSGAFAPDLYQSSLKTDFTDTVEGEFDFHDLSARWDTQFNQGQRGAMTFTIQRSVFQQVLARVPLHSWVSDITGPVTEDEVADEIIRKLNSGGVHLWRATERSGDKVTIYFTTGFGPALIALMVVGIFGIGLLVNWTIDTITVSRIKRDYAGEAIEAAQHIADPKERAEFYSMQAEATQTESLLDFGLGDEISGGVKNAVIIAAVVIAVAIAIKVVTK